LKRSLLLSFVALCLCARGVAFAQQPRSQSAVQETILFDFSLDNPAGVFPNSSLVIDGAGNLYGIGCDWVSYRLPCESIVFELSPGAEGWTGQQLCNAGEYGYGCLGGILAIDQNGNLYGVGQQGGLTYIGELSPNGQGGWTLTTLATLTGYFDSPVIDPSGALYGTAYNTKTQTEFAYQIVQQNGQWIENVLCTLPYANFSEVLVTDQIGNFYGIETTSTGSVLFDLSDATGTWTATTVYTFPKSPALGLTRDAAGNFYAGIGTGRDGLKESIIQVVQNQGVWTGSIIYTFPSWNVGPILPMIADAVGNL